MMEEVALVANGRASELRTGAVAGIIGGILYTLFVEVVNVGANGASAFFQPFRQIGAVVLGSRALDAGYDLMTATVTGTLLHLALSAVFGILLGWVRTHLSLRSIAASTALGFIAGLAFYALGVFVVFPAAFTWFLANDRLTQSIGHAFFGGATGAWLGLRDGRGRRGRRL